MNQAQRKVLAATLADLSSFSDADHCTEVGFEACTAAVGAALSVIDSMADEEQEKYDNMPEGLQNSSKGEAIQEAAEALSTARDDLNDADNVTADEDDWATTLSEAVESAINNAESF